MVYKPTNITGGAHPVVVHDIPILSLFFLPIFAS